MRRSNKRPFWRWIVDGVFIFCLLMALCMEAKAGNYVDTLRPFADNASYAQWSTAQLMVDEYTQIDEDPSNGGTDYLYSIANLAQSRHWYSDATFTFPGTDTTLDSVVVVGISSSGGISATNLRYTFDIQNDGQAVEYGDYIVTTTTNFANGGDTTRFNVPDPAGGSWSDYSGDGLDSVTAGVQKGDDADQARVTWMAVILYYTVPDVDYGGRRARIIKQ